MKDVPLVGKSPADVRTRETSSGNVCRGPGREAVAQNTKARAPGPGSKLIPRRRPTLPRGFPRSTIGAEGLNGRVRNGNGCGPFAKITGKLFYCFPIHQESRVE